MDYERIRQDIATVIAQLQLDHVAYPLVVEIDNRSVADLTKQTDPYLKVEVDYLPGGGQLDLADNPLVRQVGQICLYAIDKSGAGTAGVSKLLSFITPYFADGAMGVVRCHPPQATRGREINGWWHQPLLIDFWADAPAG
jgi:hypothetical protein